MTSLMKVCVNVIRTKFDISDSSLFTEIFDFPKWRPWDRSETAREVNRFAPFVEKIFNSFFFRQNLQGGAKNLQEGAAPLLPCSGRTL